MSPRAKHQALQRARALNAHPQQVHARLFRTHPFFDRHDRAQVKYELLRQRELDGTPLQQTCDEFGFSRESYRHILERFHAEGMAGLFGRKRGRKQPLKLTDEVRAFLSAEHERNPSLSVKDLAYRCAQDSGVTLSRRSVYRALVVDEPRKKKRARKQRQRR
jgi:transposase